MKRMSISSWQKFGGRSKVNDHYADEEHSLKGKEGKTHAPC